MTTPALDALRTLLPLLARDEDRAVTGIFGSDTLDAIDAARAAIEASANSRNEEESMACKSDDDLAFRIADEASISLVQCSAQRIDAWTYTLTGEEMADEAMDEAVTYLVQRGLAYLIEVGDGWDVILETDE